MSDKEVVERLNVLRTNLNNWVRISSRNLAYSQVALVQLKKSRADDVSQLAAVQREFGVASHQADKAAANVSTPEISSHAMNITTIGANAAELHQRLALFCTLILTPQLNSPQRSDATKQRIGSFISGSHDTLRRLEQLQKGIVPRN